MPDAITSPQQPVQGDTPETQTLAVGAGETATPAAADTGLESGMKVISTPQGKASVDKNATDLIVNAFNDAAAASAPLGADYDESGKRIIGNTRLRADPAKNKGSYVVVNSMVTTQKRSYVNGEFIPPADMTDDELAVLLGSEAIVKN